MMIKNLNMIILVLFCVGIAHAGLTEVYSTGFEQSEGYSLGAISGQQGWIGTGNVSAVQANSGVWSLEATSATATAYRLMTVQAPVVVTEFSVMPAMKTGGWSYLAAAYFTTSSDSDASTGALHVKFMSNATTYQRLYYSVWNGTSIITPFVEVIQGDGVVPIWDENGWNIVKMVTDFATSTYDLYVNDVLRVENAAINPDAVKQTGSYFYRGSANTTTRPNAYFDSIGLNYTYPLGPETCEQVWEQGYGLEADINQDCHVDMSDFAMIAAKWLNCYDPEGCL